MVLAGGGWLSCLRCFVQRVYVVPVCFGAVRVCFVCLGVPWRLLSFRVLVPGSPALLHSASADSVRPNAPLRQVP